MMFGFDILLVDFEECGFLRVIVISSLRYLVEMMLGWFDLLVWFEFMFSGDDVECGKFDLEIYFLMVKWFGIFF